jgi:CheY-like chemotaxis protein/HPt (histidine-containing phosphotransfer) domain-containing protein
LLVLLNDILDFSKIEAGQLDLESIAFDLRSTVEGVVQSLAQKAEDKGLEMACLVYHNVPAMLRGDPGRLRQVLVNLIGNAIKFTHHGEVITRVDLLEETDTIVKVRFSVSDTGIGIPANRLGIVFGRFQQADGSTTRKYGGTGLGLAISKELVTMMGGEIGVESVENQGSTFHFSIPFQKQAEDALHHKTFPIDLTDVNVLAVDDNASNLVILSKMLEGFGCRVTAVSKGAEVVPTLRSAVQVGDSFDLVLLDMQMPELDGEDTLRMIKNDPISRGVKVVILTSIGRRGDAARLKSQGCAGYLLKPVKQSQLREAISLVLGQEEASPEKVTTSFITRHVITEQKSQSSRILVAEDNDINRKLIAKLFSLKGYSIDTVENGIQAVEAVKTGDYSLLLMDVQMPEMDGFEATRAIRSLETGSQHIPIIAMTAHALQGDRERCLDAGMDDYLSKPIVPEDVFAVVNKWLTEARKSEEAMLKPQTSPAPKDQPAPLDIAKALPLFGDDQDFFIEMLGDFVDRIPVLHQELVDSLTSQDRETFVRVAHNLKGLAFNFQATRLAELAQQAEYTGLTAAASDLQTLLLQLRAEIKVIHTFYREIVPGYNV